MKSKKINSDIPDFSAILVFLLAVIVSLSGCKMSQFFSRRVEKTNIEQKSDIKETSSVRTDNRTVEKLTELTELSLDVSEKIVIVKWSAPDSSGRQFPLETTNISRHGTAGKKTTMEKEQEQKEITEREESKEDKSTVNAESEIETVEKAKTKPAMPAWVTWTAVILSAGIILLIYLILKRYRIL